MVHNGELFPGQSAKAYVHDFAESKNEPNDGKFIPKIGKCVWIQGRGFYDYVRTSLIEDFYIHEDYENSKDKIVMKPENAHLLNGIEYMQAHAGYIGKDLKKTDDFLEKNYPSLTKSSTYKSLKSGVKDIASALGFKKGGAVKTKRKK
jgi:hypothetical protein